MTTTPAVAPAARWPDRTPRLVATDLDNTLLHPDGSISPRTEAALRVAAASGIEVVFVTARPPRWITGLARHVAGHGVVICANGAAVVRAADGGLLADHGMPRALVGRLAARLRDVWGDDVHLAAESAAGYAAEHGFVSEHAEPTDSPRVARIEDALTESTFKLLVRTSPPPPSDFLARVGVALGPDALVSDSGAIALGEVSGAGVTKAATLARWANERGIAAVDVWACGDAPNDLPMLTWAGESFAVANAFDVVREAARHTCPSNADDGVAHVLEHAAALAQA
ncbi:HAD family hydrolase [Cellulomonas composti]|uniref:Hydrolase n=1 Tax=Cellulomonas composti TaxID=266130 RepID=A0A511JCZ6_9CELL|nr:HAD family hydrolase [Cellulomonas composti]GEL95583.1 hydrolase [Cellulomonas composti]